MTVDAIRSKSKRARAASAAMDAGPPALAIGESDANIFDCPSCRRPLASGTSRCPGCRTRLVAGVRASRAAMFVGVGLLVGSVVGGGVTAAVVLSSRPAVVPVVEVPPVVTPTNAPIATVAPPVIDPSIPSGALASLRQSALLNQRIADETGRLAAIMAVSDPSAVEIAKVFRALLASSTIGDGIAPDIAVWDDGATVASDLATFYGAVGVTARDALDSSIRNEAAYEAAGQEMLAVLSELLALDTASRSLAGEADLELPPVVIPGVSGQDAAPAP